MEKTNDKQWTRAIAFIVLVMWMGLSSALAQSITVKGQVLDAKSKEPLIGVSVLEKGTTNGTITDFDGNYGRIWCTEKEFCYWFYLTGKS